MGCGVNSYKTVIAIGSIPSDTIVSLTEREQVRVLHLTNHAGDTAMPESEWYKVISGDLEERTTFMALQIQFDPSLVLVADESFNEIMKTVYSEQWEGEYDDRSLLIYNDSFYEMNLTSANEPKRCDFDSILSQRLN